MEPSWRPRRSPSPWQRRKGQPCSTSASRAPPHLERWAASWEAEAEQVINSAPTSFPGKLSPSVPARPALSRAACPDSGASSPPPNMKHGPNSPRPCPCATPWVRASRFPGTRFTSLAPADSSPSASSSRCAQRPRSHPSRRSTVSQQRRSTRRQERPRRLPTSFLQPQPHCQLTFFPCCEPASRSRRHKPTSAPQIFA